METERHNLIRIVLLLVLVSVTADAFGYSYYICSNNGKVLKWPDKRIDWRAAKNSFASSYWRNALNSANGRWNQAPGRFTFAVDTWYDSSVSRGNSQNEIWFSSSQSILDGAPATCYRWAKCSSPVRWREKDIIFDVNRDWSASDIQFNKLVYGGDYRFWSSTALHEMGHALGLAHTNNTYNIMGSDQTHVMVNNNKIRHYAGEDGGNGEVFLYGKTGNSKPNDLGVTHWKYGKADGEYSQHWFTKVYTTGGSVVDTVDWADGLLRFKVKAGGTYKVQFTFENNGYYTKTVDVAWYISTNANITTYDRRIRTGSMTLARNKVYTNAHTITIPNDYEVGDNLYIGVIIDWTGKISEFSGFNNATYLPIVIVP